MGHRIRRFAGWRNPAGPVHPEEDRSRLVAVHPEEDRSRLVQVHPEEDRNRLAQDRQPEAEHLAVEANPLKEERRQASSL